MGSTSDLATSQELNLPPEQHWSPSKQVAARLFHPMPSTYPNHSYVCYYLPHTRQPFAWEQWSFWGTDATSVHAWFFRNWWPHTFLLVLAYVVGIYALRNAMLSRRAFSLRWQLALWNGCMAAFSMLATWRFSEEFWHMWWVRCFRTSVCVGMHPDGPASFWSAVFTLSKIVELGDTVFIVLRKRPLIFLHWYHHAVVLLYTWHATGRWFVYMNYCVHSVMYSYYAIVSTGLRFPRVASMVVTSLQTGQMLVGVGISLYVAWLKSMAGADEPPQLACQSTRENLAFCFLIYLSFACLFIHLFLRSYVFGRSETKSMPREKVNALLAKGRESMQINGATSPTNSFTKENGALANGNGRHNSSNGEHLMGRNTRESLNETKKRA